MTPYELGRKAALTKSAVYPEEYNASGALGGLGGGAIGAAAGGYLGGELGQHISHLTRSKFLGIPVPWSGAGEHVVGQNDAKLLGEGLGAFTGGSIGGAMGYHGGHLAAIRKAPPPRRLVDHNNMVDPRLMSYLTQQPQG